MSKLKRFFFDKPKAIFNFLSSQSLSFTNQIFSLRKKTTEKLSKAIPSYQDKTSNSTAEKVSSLFVSPIFSKEKAEIVGFGMSGQYRLRREKEEMESDISSSAIMFVSSQSKASEDFAAEPIVSSFEVRPQIHFDRDRNSDSEEDDSGFGSSRSSLKSSSSEDSFFQAPPNSKPKPKSEAVVTTEKKDTSIDLSDHIKNLQGYLRQKLDEIVYIALNKICNLASLSEDSEKEILEIKSVIDFIKNNFVTFFLPSDLWDHNKKVKETFSYKDTLFLGYPFYIKNKDFIISLIEDHEKFIFDFINKIEEDYKETLENNSNENEFSSEKPAAKKFYWQNETDYLNEVLSALKGIKQKLKEIKSVIKDIETELDCLIKKDSQKKIEQSTQSIVESVDCVSFRR